MALLPRNGLTAPKLLFDEWLVWVADQAVAEGSGGRGSLAPVVDYLRDNIPAENSNCGHFDAFSPLPSSPGCGHFVFPLAGSAATGGLRPGLAPQVLRCPAEEFSQRSFG